MNKNKFISARCTRRTKEKIVNAAEYKGITETDFIVSTLLKEAEKYDISFSKLLVGGKLSEKEIRQINSIKDLDKSEGRDNETIWFNKRAEMALKIDENNKVLMGYLTNKKELNK